MLTTDEAWGIKHEKHFIKYIGTFADCHKKTRKQMLARYITGLSKRNVFDGFKKQDAMAFAEKELAACK